MAYTVFNANEVDILLCAYVAELLYDESITHSRNKVCSYLCEDIIPLRSVKYIYNSKLSYMNWKCILTTLHWVHQGRYCKPSTNAANNISTCQIVLKYFENLFAIEYWNMHSVSLSNTIVILCIGWQILNNVSLYVPGYIGLLHNPVCGQDQSFTAHDLHHVSDHHIHCS